MSIEDENFAVALAEKCETHQQWLSVVRFGLPTLVLVNQPLLMELIVREAERQAKNSSVLGRSPADEARVIMAELGLVFLHRPVPKH